MNLTKNELIGLPVFTQSSQHLGKVVDFDFNPLSQEITTYRVKSSSIIKELLQPELLINKDQVVSISHEKMTVVDTTAAEPILKKQPKSGITNPSLPVN